MREKGKFTPPTPRSICLIDWGSVLFGNEDDSGGSGSSGIVDHLIDQAATLTNTALLSNANPVNTAILTNTPISTPQISTGVSNSSLWVVGGLFALGLLGIFAIRESR